MTPEMNLFAWAWIDVAWYLLSIVVFFAMLLLMGLILIQDSKDTGLTSAFGGGSSSSLMGARMQKDLAKLTGVLGIILAVCLTTMGLITADTTGRTLGATDAVTPPPNVPAPPSPPAGEPLGLGKPGFAPFGQPASGFTGQITAPPGSSPTVTITPPGTSPTVAPPTATPPTATPPTATPPTATSPPAASAAAPSAPPAPPAPPAPGVPVSGANAVKDAPRDASPAPPAPVPAPAPAPK